jgi:hypothetical protein
LQLRSLGLGAYFSQLLEVVRIHGSVISLYLGLLFKKYMFFKPISPWPNEDDYEDSYCFTPTQSCRNPPSTSFPHHATDSNNSFLKCSDLGFGYDLNQIGGYAFDGIEPEKEENKDEPWL